ncbi:MAG: hypothetical protein KDE26_12400 [Bacteroidetes bacterium]|nr:hypothetical protein [Bacteroidota bacterium]
MNKFKKQSLLLILGVGFIVGFVKNVHAQKGKDTVAVVLTPEQMQEDLDSLKSFIYRTPTDPFAFISRSEWEKNFEKISAKLTQPMATLAFFRLVNPLVLSLKDIHSRIWLPDDRNSYVLQGGYFLPLNPRFLDRRVYIMDDHKDLIPKGSELIAVNGKAIYWVMRDMLEATYTDGEVKSTQTRLMEENFTNLLPWFCQLDSINTLQLRLRDSKKDTLIYYPGARKKSKKKSSGPDFNDFHQLEFLSDNQIAVLTIGSFAKGWENRYRSFLRSSFRKINQNGTENLIIDIRGNKGGYIIRGPELLSYIADSAYYYAYTSIVKSSPLFKAKIKYSMIVPGLAIPLFKNKIGKELVSGWQTPLDTYDTLQWEPSAPKSLKKRFKGEVYLLTDGLSISNSCLIHHAFSKNELGTVIGNTCGCISSGTFGNSVDFRLPHSGVRGRVSTIRLTSGFEEFDFQVEGLNPDYIVEDNIDDLVNEKDTQLEFVLKLIKDKSSRIQSQSSLKP